MLASKINSNRFYVTLSGYRYGADEGHVYLALDNGSSWVDLSTSLPDIPVNDIVQADNGSLYLATDVGVFGSANGGTTWEPLGVNIPNVVVTDLHIHEDSSYLYAATYGRSIYEIDLSQIILDNN